MRVRFGCWLVFGATVLLAPSVVAQSSDAAARATARKLGNAGIDAYQASDFQGAAEKLDKAYGVLQAPSLGLWSARAFVKNGRLVEASERYLEVTRLAVSGGDKQVQEQAKLDAQKELDLLTPRIPSIIIKLEGATAEQVAIAIDGKPVKSQIVGEAAPIDPGSHKVSGMRGAETVEAAVTLAESREESVLLRFDPNVPAPGPAVAGGAPTGAAAPTQASTADGAPSRATDAPAEESKKSVLPKLAWISIGLGAAGVAAGGVTGVMALQKENELEANGECVGGCKDTGRYQNFLTLRTVATVCFVAGGTLVGTGIVLLVLAPSSSGTTVSLSVAPGEARLSGTF